MNRIVFFLITFLSINLSFAGDVDKVVVVVNDDAITQYDVNEFMQATLASIPDDKRDYVANDLKKQQISLMVDQALILGVAKNQHIKATDEMVNNTLTKIQSSMHMDDDAFVKHLNEFNISLDQFKAHVEKNITSHLVQEMVVRDTIKITPKMIAHHISTEQQANTTYQFNDYRINKEHLTSQQQLDHANRLQKGIKEHTKIPDSIKSFVIRTPFADTNKESIPEVFYKKLLAQKPPSVIGPFKLDNGYHVIWYRERKLPKAISEAEAGNAILSQKADETINHWMKRLHDSAYIQFFS
ncbi:MAG: SurA N-terminal domain-containing protein [Pseudomonadota bacterium]|nr:SurA N-terminal domain-containing protein [Pseudomonadota bacterium]